MLLFLLPITLQLTFVASWHCTPRSFAFGQISTFDAQSPFIAATQSVFVTPAFLTKLE